MYVHAPWPHASASGSSEHRATRAPSCSACCATHPDLEVVIATGDSQAGTRAADLYPGLAAAYPDLVFEAYEPTAFDGLDLAFLALPHGASQDLVPDLRKRVGKVVDLAADFRLKDAVALPDLVPRRAHRARAAGRVRLRHPRAVPRRGRGRRPRRRRRLLRHRRRARARAARAGRCHRDHRDRRRRRQRRVRRRPGPEAEPALRHRRTRTSPPTACSTTATRRRSSRPSAPRCSSPPTWPR